VYSKKQYSAMFLGTGLAYTQHYNHIKADSNSRLNKDAAAKITNPYTSNSSADNFL